MSRHDLTSFNTLALKSAASTVLLYRDATQLPAISAGLASQPPAFVLGGGSNVVLAPCIRRPIIKVETRGIQVRETNDYWEIEAAAGESWHGLVSYCVQHGMGGLENLALIPGTVGAAPVQNIGAYGVELDQRLHAVHAWDLQRAQCVRFSSTDCGFAYRDSLFKREAAGRWLITSVVLRLPRKWHPVLSYPDLRDDVALQERDKAVSPADVFDAVCRIRRRKLPDPARRPNAGSFFKNPVIDETRYRQLSDQWPGLVAYALPESRWKLAAGWLIEQSGWKGRELGPVGMHDRQALVLVNHGGASAVEVMRLADDVCSSVRERFGVELEREPVWVD